jgi:hypothetical protein
MLAQSSQSGIKKWCGAISSGDLATFFVGFAVIEGTKTMVARRLMKETESGCLLFVLCLKERVPFPKFNGCLF